MVNYFVEIRVCFFDLVVVRFGIMNWDWWKLVNGLMFRGFLMLWNVEIWMDIDNDVFEIMVVV